MSRVRYIQTVNTGFIIEKKSNGVTAVTRCLAYLVPSFEAAPQDKISDLVICRNARCVLYERCRVVIEIKNKSRDV